MTTPIAERLLELAERCEAAAGPDHDLSADIHGLVHGYEKRWNEKFGFHQYWKDGRWLAAGQMPDYTASLDAAMTLVPEGADSGGVRFNVEKWNEQSVYPPHVKATAWVAGARRTYAATPALALCAAALRARTQPSSPSSEGVE